VQMAEIARQVIESLEKQAQAKAQRLTLVCYSTPLPEALGDSGRLAQVLTNLISNAIKYTPQGGKIEVSLEAAPEASHLTARVSDTGIGISVADQQKLFTRFFRAAHPFVQAENGTGLGLSIVKRIVEMHGGTISVYSVPERGSTFSFTVPLAK
jgi:two-component system, OmpR family, phosphate regulon sensor histidine kinase PhoR